MIEGLRMMKCLKFINIQGPQGSAVPGDLTTKFAQGAGIWLYLKSCLGVGNAWN